LDAGDDNVALDACLLDSVQTFVEVNELAMHLLEILAEAAARFWISYCMVEVVESMDRLVSRYSVRGRLGGGPRWRLGLGEVWASGIGREVAIGRGAGGAGRGRGRKDKPEAVLFLSQ
jgi:hypothetical protein